jgi:hypothetical protein
MPEPAHWPVEHHAAMQDRQRTVMVVASGLAWAVVAVTINRLLADDGGGWFAYAPNTGEAFPARSATDVWREAAVWLGAIAAWAGLALWLYRPRPRPDA